MRKQYYVIGTLVIAAGIIAGCTFFQHATCAAETAAASTAANLLTQGLSCEAPEAVLEDVTAAVAKVTPSFCTAAPTAGLPTAACELVVPVLVQGVAAAGIPAKWKCHPTNATAAATTLLSQACQLLTPPPTPAPSPAPTAG